MQKVCSELNRTIACHGSDVISIGQIGEYAYQDIGIVPEWRESRGRSAPLTGGSPDENRLGRGSQRSRILQADLKLELSIPGENGDDGLPTSPVAGLLYLTFSDQSAERYRS